MRTLPTGWMLMGMGQVFPIATAGAPAQGATPFNATAVYATQPAVMLNVESPGSRVVLRTTLNFEGVTQRRGELTFGGWGEGFIDSRHPHTLLHEAMVSVNLWDVSGGALSVSAGKGFAPYGTDDPMGRPVVKYPTNHHLSQILERWTANAVYLKRGWSLEAGVFGGAEPTGPYDFGNVASFGNSWSVRGARRFGGGFGPLAAWEASASYAQVAEAHGGHTEKAALMNVAVRHQRAHAVGTVYALAEASRSRPQVGAGYYALLAETRVELGAARRHQPYYRAEYATRPEFQRVDYGGSDDFFRYVQGAHAGAATRWLINSVGYGFEARRLPVSARPFVEVQHHRVWAEPGAQAPRAAFGTDAFLTVSAGARLYFGAGPMRMGAYGVLDPMTASMRPERAVRGRPAPHEEH